MQEVAAYQDVNGALHKSKRDAMEADFTIALVQAWLALPAGEKGDPVVIARLVARSSSTRQRLLEALTAFENYMQDANA